MAQTWQRKWKTKLSSQGPVVTAFTVQPVIMPYMLSVQLHRWAKSAFEENVVCYFRLERTFHPTKGWSQWVQVSTWLWNRLYKVIFIIAWPSNAIRWPLRALLKRGTSTVLYVAVTSAVLFRFSLVKKWYLFTLVSHCQWFLTNERRKFKLLYITDGQLHTLSH